MWIRDRDSYTRHGEAVVVPDVKGMNLRIAENELDKQSEDKKSTGIGLFLCKKILTKLFHTITVTSEVGKGTAVKLGLDTVSLGVE